jgi:hypothetical protein
MQPFFGVLLRTDRPSAVPPKGAHGRNIRIREDALRASVPELVGKPLYASTCLTKHDVQREIGTITSAAVLNGLVVVRGMVAELHALELAACEEPLGMSYDASEAVVEDTSLEDVWVVRQVMFAGATVVLQRKAAHKADSLFVLRGAFPQRGAAA